MTTIKKGPLREGPPRKMEPNTPGNILKGGGYGSVRSTSAPKGRRTSAPVSGRRGGGKAR